MAIEYRVDAETKQLVKITESVTSEEDLRAELSAESEGAQNRLNLANDAVAQGETNLTAAQEMLEAARAEQVAASQEAQFSADRLAGLDAQLQLLHGVDESEAPADDAGSSEAQAVDVHVAPIAAV